MARLESINNTPLFRDRVYEVLRKEILSGGFAPGESLNILGISKEMGVSCAPVREALNLLEKDGLVELMPYKRAIVANGTDIDYEVAFDLRIMLEPYALKHSALLIPKEALSEMRNILEDCYNHPDSVADFYDVDDQFHHMLYDYLDSKLMISTLNMVRVYTKRYYYRRFDMLVTGKKKQNHNDAFNEEMTIRDETMEHISILDAIEAGDVDKAVRLLEQHINMTSSSIT